MILLVRNSPVAMVAAALALGAPLSLSEAFVVQPSSSVISRSAWRRGITSSAFPARRPVRGETPVTSTSLQMNLADRFFRVAKANLNSILQKVEDPEKILEQAVEDMQKDLVKVRQSYAEVSASQKRMERQREHAEGLAKEWYNRAQLALQNGDEGLAKEALARRQQQLDVSANLSQQMTVQGEAIDKLRESTQQLESKITEAKGQKDTLIARARTAKTTTQVNDMLGNLSGTTSMGAFDRMQEKVEALEANAEISGELSGASSATLEGQFKALEGKSAVDEELARMKGLLPQKKDPPPLLTTSASSEVESELDQMKKDLERGAGQ